MGVDGTSSSIGAALGVRQGLVQADFAAKALSQTAQQQDATVTTLLASGDGAPGGSVTPTRGQNLNIVV